MDKQTLSHYGWIIIMVLILAVMLAFATPFGEYIGKGVSNIAIAMGIANDNAVDENNIDKMGKEWEDYLNSGGSGGSNLDMSTVDTTLENNSWDTIQKVVKAGKATEAGWSVGDTKTLTYNGVEYTARIIGLDQDGTNTATFMFTSSIENRIMNPSNDDIGYGVNTGGFSASEINAWLNNTGYEALGDDVEAVIKSVSKTHNLGYENPTGTSSTSCKLFLLSVEEVGLKEDLIALFTYPYKDSVDAESTFTYTYFQTDGKAKRVENSNNGFWLRSAYAKNDNDFFFVYNYGDLGYNNAEYSYDIVPAFVIG